MLLDGQAIYNSSGFGGGGEDDDYVLYNYTSNTSAQHYLEIVNTWSTDEGHSSLDISRVRWIYRLIEYRDLTAVLDRVSD